jgi:hypothetical protein
MINAPIRPDKRARSEIENEASLSRLFSTGAPKPYELKTMRTTTMGAAIESKLKHPKFNEFIVKILIRVQKENTHNYCGPNQKSQNNKKRLLFFGYVQCACHKYLYPFCR